MKNLIGKGEKNQMQGMKNRINIDEGWISFWTIKYSKNCRKKEKVMEKIIKSQQFYFMLLNTPLIGVSVKENIGKRKHEKEIEEFPFTQIFESSDW